MKSSHRSSKQHRYICSLYHAQAAHTHVGSLYYAYTLNTHTSLCINACHSYPLSTLVITYQLSSYLALNQLPSSVKLSHVNELSESVRQQMGYRANTITVVTTHSLYNGGGLPPIPKKLIRRIQDGHFINMVELLSDNL